MLRERPQRDDWTTLKYRLPSDFSRLCALCIEYNRLRERMFTYMPNIDREFGDLNDLIQSIISEYKKIMQLSLDKKSMESVDKDITAMLSRFIAKDGRIEIPLEEFRMSRDEGWMEAFLSGYVSTFNSFIESRIYGIIKSIVEGEMSGWFIGRFAYNSSRAAGIYPEFRPKEFEATVVPTVKKREKKKEKKEEEEEE